MSKKSKLPASEVRIVGIGASAGGLSAFEDFFSAMPADTDLDLAFVLVQHLAPDHKSILTELVQRKTKMQVFEVEDGIQVQSNCVYIIPPNHDLYLKDGCLRLLSPGAPRGLRLPIDFFFQSLAREQREQSIGIVLSGTGSDGTLGARAIKTVGGMVMAQSPASAEFAGMPQSVIDAGFADQHLSPHDMPASLLRTASQIRKKVLADVGKPTNAAKHPSESKSQGMEKIFATLREQTGHDLSQYKPGTIQRRIGRRMAVHKMEALTTYADYIESNPKEVRALFQELLIGVTHFFRDAGAFQFLQNEIIAKIFENKPADAVIRVWTAGCSTGEEAYSLAIVLLEYIQAHNLAHTLQVFATDIDAQAIAAARSGFYPSGIRVHISPERLARYFTLDADGIGYRVRKEVRNLLIFSNLDVIRDPPFSKLDLISCRNLMIYFGPELQRRLIPMFHYALKANGILFLGTSEGIGEFDTLFTVLSLNSTKTSGLSGRAFLS